MTRTWTRRGARRWLRLWWIPAIVLATVVTGTLVLSGDAGRSPEPSGRADPTGGTGTARGTGKKGVGAWYFPGVGPALARSGVAWYYTWSATPGTVAAPPGMTFVPMIWGASQAGTYDLDAARGQGGTLLGFNEPDIPEQANMSVGQALDLWPRLMATGQRLGSPAPADYAATPGSWLDRFMTGAKHRGYRVDFITVHWYGRTFADTGAAVTQLQAYLQAVYDRYHLPVWLTEYSLADFTSGVALANYASPDQQAAFVTASLPMLEQLPFLERYAWFALSDSGASGFRTGLYSENAEPTPAGAAYRDNPR